MSYNPYDNVLATVENAANILGYKPAEYEAVKYPERELSVSVPVRMDNGSVKVFKGYRVQHSTVRGPAKGGIRYHQNVTLSDGEKQRLTRRFTSMISPIIGPDKDIPAPDVGTNAEVMGWIMDTYSMLNGHSTPTVVTGKPIALGGSEGRNEATGRGIMLNTLYICQKLGIDIKAATVTIQGMGNVGSVTAKLLDKEGAKIVAVSDVSGGIYNGNGLNIPAILEYLSVKGNLLSGYNEDGMKRISNEELLTLDTTILIPAALENQINKDNADKIKAKVIVEGANGPTTIEADEILDKKGVVLVPDILANSGGVIVSYFEWVQNLQSFEWTEEEVNSKLARKMSKAFENVYGIAKEKNVSLRTGAYLIALKSVVDTTKLRGIWP